MRPSFLLSLLVASPALADWWHVGSAPGPVPVSDPVCVGNCESASPSNNSQRSNNNTNTRDPAAEARRAAAEEAARRDLERRTREAVRELEEVRNATRRQGELGASVRDQAHRFSDYREQFEQREGNVRSLRDSLAPVVVEKPAAGARTPLSMKEYCDRLNAAAAPARGLRPSEVPSPGTARRTAALQEAPVISPGRFAGVAPEIERARAALREEANELAESIGWRLIDRHVPFLKSVRETFESGKQNYEALTNMTTRLATTAFTHAEDVALTVGGAGGNATNEDNDRIVRSMGRDVNDTSSKLLADQARGALKDSMLDRASEWFFPGEEP